MNYDVIILGSGPGGYVTAIRASQLGLKTAVIEKESLGGVCLNWGCIPTKALLKSAQVFNYINHAEDFGITVKNANADFPNIIKRSRDVAEGMSKGISYLLKKNKMKVSYHDPFIPYFKKTRKFKNFKNLKSTILNEKNIKNFDASIIVTDHDKIDYSIIKKYSKIIIDCRGKFNLSNETKNKGLDKTVDIEQNVHQKKVENLELNENM